MTNEQARLQLRWEKAPDGTSVSGGPSWYCHYELVLPLREHDIRRDDEDGNETRSEAVIALKEPTIRGSSRLPCWDGEGNTYIFDAPYRDGAHATWDATLLGNLPIVCVAPDGTMIQKPDKPSVQP